MKDLCGKDVQVISNCVNLLGQGWAQYGNRSASLPDHFDQGFQETDAVQLWLVGEELR